MTKAIFHKQIILWLLLIIKVIPLTASIQWEQQADSLWNLIEQAPLDSHKVNLCNKISWEYKDINPEFAIKLVELSKELAKSLNYSAGMAYAYKSTGGIYWTLGYYSQALKSFENAQKIFDNYPSSLDSRTTNKEIATCINYMGILYKLLGKYSLSIERFKEALTISQKLKDPSLTARIYINLSNVYFLMGKYSIAIKYLTNAQNIYKKSNDKSGIANTLIHIGKIYLAQENYDIAYNYFNEARKLFEKVNEPNNLATVYDNIGTIYLLKKNYNKSISYYSKAIEILKNTGTKIEEASLQNKLGNAYCLNNKFDEAYNHLKNALAIANTYNDKQEKARILSNLSLLFYKEKKYAEAISYSYEAISLLEEIDSKLELKDAYEIHSKIYEAIEQYDKALKYYKLARELKDSLINEQVRVQLLELNAIYENEQNQKELEIKQLQLSKKESEVKKQNLQLYTLFIGFAISLVLAIIAYRNYLAKKRANQILNKHNKLISLKNDEIHNQSRELERINKELEKLSVVASETDNAVLICDANGDFEWFNKAFTKIYGYTLEEFKKAKGTNIFEVSHEKSLKQMVEDAAKKHKSIIYDSSFINAHGKRLWLQTTLTPITDVSGQILKIIAIDSDITSLKKAEERIKLQNKEIRDSIIYASRIQSAVLPPQSLINKIFRDSFILFIPRDIVSGDFYWATEINGKSIIAAVDCTGHGVPGAFMSMLANGFLNEIITVEKVINSNEILNRLRENVIKALRQTGKEGEAKDGMDIALCIYDSKTGILEYSGANSPLYIISIDPISSAENVLYGNGYALSEIKADKMPIGIHYNKTTQSFTKKTFKLKQGDMFYIFSDGFADQFGGNECKKFKYQNFKQVLLDNCFLSMDEQRRILYKTYNDWIGDLIQIDDVLVVGIKV